LNSGERPGTAWIPAECDVSIRPGWFYHPAEDDKVKTPAKLLDIYYRSVGRGACLNLNLPPDRRGRIHDHDIAALREFRRILDATFAVNLAAGARVETAAARPGGRRNGPRRLVDGRRDTFWAAADEAKSAEVEITLKRSSRLNVVDLREHLPLGQRVEAFGLDRWEGGKWVEFATGTSIGNRRLVRLPEKIETERVRLRVIRAAAGPALSEIGLHCEP
jgi:alpha-L-fucosidase